MKKPKKKKTTRRLAPYPPELGNPRQHLGEKRFTPMGVWIGQDPAFFVGIDEHHALIKSRCPEAFRALVNCAYKLHGFDCILCNVGESEAISEAIEHVEQLAAGIARWIYGDSAQIYHQQDPRGCPLYVQWDKMPDRLRSIWDSKRGLPIYLELSKEWREEWEADPE